MNIVPIAANVEIRTYALVTSQGETKLACYAQNKWVIDNTCESINELLQAGLICEDSINGWIERRLIGKNGE
tara:strand:- start:81 stop:296 length:216 start_codon:yes stop_codon:yes gene_type:complete